MSISTDGALVVAGTLDGAIRFKCLMEANNEEISSLELTDIGSS